MLRGGSNAVGMRGAVVTAATLVSAACTPSPEERGNRNKLERIGATPFLLAAVELAYEIGGGDADDVDEGRGD